MRNAEYLAILAAGLFFLASTNSYTQTPNLGMPIDEQDIAAWDIDILPDGTGLPLGQGTAGEGKIIYEQKCAVCHGANGEGGISPALAGGDPLSNGIDTGKTIGNLNLDIAGTYCFHSFKYPDLFPVEDDTRTEYDLVRESQLQLYLAVSYKF